MAGELILKKGDQKPEAEVQLLDGNNDPVDLSGADVKFYAYDSNTDKLIIDGEDVTITDAANGKVTYQYTQNDVEETGLFKAEFVAVYSDGDLTFPNNGYIPFIVNPDAQGGRD